MVVFKEVEHRSSLGLRVWTDSEDGAPGTPT